MHHCKLYLLHIANQACRSHNVAGAAIRASNELSRRLMFYNQRESPYMETNRTLHYNPYIIGCSQPGEGPKWVTSPW